MASSHKKERPFVCPFCQKTFKTSVLCKKHMKIHRKDLAEANNEELNSAFTVNTIFKPSSSKMICGISINGLAVEESSFAI